MENPLIQADYKSRAVAILGMHRSGTSTVARAINLMGVYLGDAGKMMPGTADNAEGYWEHLEIYDLQVRLLDRLDRDWNIAEPLPEGWLQSEAVKPFKAELAGIIAANFGGRQLWAWKEPRSCILLPLWREVLEGTQTKLSCLFVVRSPVDVASSLMRRDGIPFSQALGIWFHYNLAALKDAAGLPMVFLSYEQLLTAWEPEIHRCAATLNLDRPANEQKYREAMNAFIQPGLRHNQSSAVRLLELPHPVQELYQVLLEACRQSSAGDGRLMETVNRLSKDFHAYASFFPKELKRLGREQVVVRDKTYEIQLLSTIHGPKLVHNLLGKKMCHSVCKRLAAAYCWFRP